MEGFTASAMPDEKGVWRGLDVDTGRAIAAAIFGDPDKIRYVTLTTQTRFTALQSKEVDVLCRNATKTLTRETELGLNFVAVNYYDGQGFLVPKKLGVKSAKELNGASVCVLPRHHYRTECGGLFPQQQDDDETGCYRTKYRTEPGFLCTEDATA